MANSIENVVIIGGGGYMGSGILALHANVAEEAGFSTITSLDMVPDDVTGDDDRNRFAQSALEKIAADRASGFTLPSHANRITVGNTEDDLARAVSNADLVIEAVFEDPKVKRELYGKIAPHLKSGAILTSNTSGIPIADLMEGFDEDIQRRFAVTHFFGPVRQMPLLEVIASDQTDPEVVNQLADYGTNVLGKRVVVGKDTPGFVSNRIGVQEQSMLTNFALVHEPETIDYVLGKHLLGLGGKPFVTMERVGLDTLLDVHEDIRRRTEGIDSDLRVKEVPDYLRDMVSKGLLGVKSERQDSEKGGFYRGRGREVYNVATGQYGPARRWGKGGPDFESVENAKKADSIQDAHAIMFAALDEGGEIYREIVMKNVAYALQNVGVIADSIATIDNAIKWGWNRAVGPGEIFDAVGSANFAAWAGREGIGLPDWVDELASRNHTLYRTDEQGRTSVFDINSKKYVQIEEPTNVISMGMVAKRTGILEEIPNGVRILDLGDGVLGVDIRSKGGTINREVIDGINRALDMSEQDDYVGVVIANPKDPNFSLGGDLEVLQGLSIRAERGEDWANEAQRAMSGAYQDLNMRLRYHSKPVVTAKQGGMAIGGGWELGAGSYIRAGQELRTGLVETAVGIVPGGAGLKELIYIMRDQLTERDTKDANPSEYAMATAIALISNWGSVSTSADHARELGYLREEDGISRNPAALVYDAKQDVLRLSEGYKPPSNERPINLPGSEAYHAIMGLDPEEIDSGSLPKDYVPTILEQLAEALTTGPDGQEQEFSEQEILGRELKAFMQLSAGAHARELAAKATRKDIDAFVSMAIQATEPYRP